MKPWIRLDQTTLPGGETMTLDRHDDTFVIRVNGQELMSSQAHSSEDALGVLGCEAIAGRPKAEVLIGGLGLGFTLAAALGKLAKDADVVVAELVPAVVTWNREYLADLSGHSLNDPRVTIHQGDVRTLIHGPKEAWDAVLLDVDNGPQPLTRQANERLYSPGALKATHDALKPGGVLAIWSAAQDATFTRRCEKAGFKVKLVQVHAAGEKGRRHWIWIATPNNRPQPRKPQFPRKH